MTQNQMTPNQSQIDRFKQAARDLECDENEARWDATLKKVAAQKPRDDPKPE